jgi:hypothetical protein
MSNATEISNEHQRFRPDSCPELSDYFSNSLQSLVPAQEEVPFLVGVLWAAVALLAWVLWALLQRVAARRRRPLPPAGTRAAALCFRVSLRRRSGRANENVCAGSSPIFSVMI